MSRPKVTLSLLLTLLVFILIAFIALQYNSYFQQHYRLLQSDEQNRQLLKAIEPVRQRQEAFASELSELEKRYEALRRQIPESMQLDVFRQELETQFKKQGLKVLAKREARFNRPSYQEVRLSYSLKGSVKTVQRVVNDFEAQPRIVQIKGPEKDSKENTGLVISIFSVSTEKQETMELPKCLEAPDKLWLSFLGAELDLLYSDYRRTCDFLNENHTLYHDIQRQGQLTQSVERLEDIRNVLSLSR